MTNNEWSYTTPYFKFRKAERKEVFEKQFHNIQQLETLSQAH